ncbi:hypothetical protein ACXR2T_09265 [Leucobacter sp. HY1910]
MAVSTGARAMGILFAAALGLTLAGCSGSAVGGGDTTCSEYLAMGSDDQKQVIRNFQNEKGDSDPANGKVILFQQSAKLYCSTVGSDSDPIRNIDG